MPSKSDVSSGMSAPDGDDSVIDTHAHYVDPGALDEMARSRRELAPVLKHQGGEWSVNVPSGSGSAVPQTRSVPVPAGLVDMNLRIAEMDRQGITVQALRNFSILDFDGRAAEAEVSRVTERRRGAHQGVPDVRLKDAHRLKGEDVLESDLVANSTEVAGSTLVNR